MACPDNLTVVTTNFELSSSDFFRAFGKSPFKNMLWRGMAQDLTVDEAVLFSWKTNSKLAYKCSTSRALELEFDFDFPF